MDLLLRAYAAVPPLAIVVYTAAAACGYTLLWSLARHWRLTAARTLTKGAASFLLGSAMLSLMPTLVFYLWLYPQPLDTPALTVRAMGRFSILLSTSVHYINLGALLAALYLARLDDG